MEVCSGCGGMSTGFIHTGFKPLLINEIDKVCCDTLSTNHSEYRDVIDKTDMLKLDLTRFKRRVNVLVGGMPCQSFSSAGERKGLDDPRGKLILEFNRLINECEPDMFVVENVKGLLTHRGGQTMNEILELFANTDKYTVCHKVLNAKDFSVPQKRERVIIVGIRTDRSLNGSLFKYPTQHTTPVLLRDVLTNAPPIGPDNPCMSYSEEKRRVLDLVPQGGCWVDLPEDIQRAYMGEASMKSGGGKRGMARRLSMDEQCLTLLTSPAQKQTDRCHPLETRPLSVREYARIQTFPDSYVFHGSVANQYKQIGNAVPVKLAHAIASSIRSYLETSTPI